uniref:Uncharacterized protein n=1 Tax=Solanum tuberosum TaxID=4113 RepID=M1DSL2_SOLTU
MQVTNLRVLSFSVKIEFHYQILKPYSIILGKNEFAAKMERNQDVEVELTEEELMLKLHRITQKIREVEEKTMEVDFATAVKLANSAAMDIKIETRKKILTMVNEEIAMTLEKKEDTTLEIQKLREKYPFLVGKLNATVGEDVKPEIAERKPKNEVGDTTLFLG